MNINKLLFQLPSLKNYNEDWLQSLALDAKLHLLRQHSYDLLKKIQFLGHLILLIYICELINFTLRYLHIYTYKLSYSTLPSVYNSIVYKPRRYPRINYAESSINLILVNIDHLCFIFWLNLAKSLT